MHRLRSPLSIVLLTALLGGVAAVAEVAEAPSTGDAAFIIVNPAGRGNQSKAEGFLADFARALCASWPRDAGPCPEWSGHYHVHQADALASIRGRRPVIGLLSPGFYLALRDELGAEPRLVPVLPGGGSAERVHCVVPAGSAAATTLADGSVAGLRLGGQLVGEPVWTRRVLLHGLSGVDEAELMPQARTLRAVRALRKGDVDAVLLVEEDWLRLQELGMAEGLVSARATEGLLAGPLALLGAGEEEQRRLGERAVAAIRRFPETPEGRSVLETMGLEGFAPAAEDDYHRLAGLYQGAAGEP